MTAEEIFKGSPEFEVRSGGTQPSARIPITEGMLRWADVIFVMEKSHLQRLNERHSQILREKLLAVLHIPDDYEFMQEELTLELEAKVTPVLQQLLRGGERD